MNPELGAPAGGTLRPSPAEAKPRSAQAGSRARSGELASEPFTRPSTPRAWRLDGPTAHASGDNNLGAHRTGLSLPALASPCTSRCPTRTYDESHTYSDCQPSGLCRTGRSPG